MPSSKNENLILTYSVLAGLTPLIPLPLVDDLARTQFRRHLLQKLAEANAQPLTPDDIKILADEKGGSCLLGCLGTALIYPLKFIFRKVFFFLEWKRAIDTAGATYYHGFLADYALQKNWCSPRGKHSLGEVRAAIDAVVAETDPSIINRAMRGAFAQSKGTLQSVVGQLTANLRRNKNTTTDVSRTIASEEASDTAQLQNVVGQLQNSLNQIPESHFDTLRRRLAEALNENL